MEAAVELAHEGVAHQAGLVPGWGPSTGPGPARSKASYRRLRLMATPTAVSTDTATRRLQPVV